MLNVIYTDRSDGNVTTIPVNEAQAVRPGVFKLKGSDPTLGQVEALVEAHEGSDLDFELHLMAAESALIRFDYENDPMYALCPAADRP